MNNYKLRKLITAAFMAAITCVATFTIHFPTPIGGYIHPGDAFVILSGIILGPIYGAASAGLGSMTADLITGFPIYAPATFVIKALTAALCAFVYKKGKIGTVILAGILGSVVVTLGYFIYDSFLYDVAGALANAPLNGIQNILGIVISTLLFPLLHSVPQIRDMMDNKR